MQSFNFDIEIRNGLHARYYMIEDGVLRVRLNISRLKLEVVDKCLYGTITYLREI
jgi:hypothetical protein